MIDVSNLYHNRYGKKTDQNFSKIDITPLINSIISRASVRKFSKKKISKELLTPVSYTHLTLPTIVDV